MPMETAGIGGDTRPEADQSVRRPIRYLDCHLLGQQLALSNGASWTMHELAVPRKCRGEKEGAWGAWADRRDHRALHRLHDPVADRREALVVHLWSDVETLADP